MADQDPQPAAAAAAAAAAPVSLESLQQPYGLSGRLVVKKFLEAGRSLVGQTVVVGGWVRSGRTAQAGALAFVELSDGSTPGTLQAVFAGDAFKDQFKALTSTGAALMLRGEVKQHPEKDDVVEVHATELLHLGECLNTYPISKGKQAKTLEFLRSHIHLRVRTQVISAVTRVRNCLAAATHRFFQGQGFVYVHTPLITSSDCEGAGEMFQVTTLVSQAEKNGQTPAPTPEQIQAAEQEIAAGDETLATMRAEKKDKRKIKKLAEELDLKRNDLAALKDRAASLGGLPRVAETGQIDYRKDFFGKPAFLTVSGQLEAEIYACALTR